MYQAKKQISFILFIVMLLSTINVCSFEDAIYNFDTSYEVQPYNSRISGNSNSFGGGWATISPFPQQLNVVDGVLGKNRGDQSIKYTLNSESSSYLHLYVDNYIVPTPKPIPSVGPYRTYSPPPSTTEYNMPISDAYVKMAVYIPKVVTNDIKIRHEYTFNNGAGGAGTAYTSFIRFHKDGGIYFNNEKVVLKFQENQWYTISAVWKKDVSKFDFYINNKLIKENYTPNGNETNLRRCLQGINFSGTPLGNAFMMYDDFEFINKPFEKNNYNTDVKSSIYTVENQNYKNDNSNIDTAKIKNVNKNTIAKTFLQNITPPIGGSIKVVRIADSSAQYPFSTIELTQNTTLDVNCKLVSKSKNGDLKIYSLEFAPYDIRYDLQSLLYTVDNVTHTISNIPFLTTDEELKKHLNANGYIVNGSGMETKGEIGSDYYFLVITPSNNRVWYQLMRNEDKLLFPGITKNQPLNLDFSNLNTEILVDFIAKENGNYTVSDYVLGDLFENDRVSILFSSSTNIKKWYKNGFLCEENRAISPISNLIIPYSVENLSAQNIGIDSFRLGNSDVNLQAKQTIEIVGDTIFNYPFSKEFLLKELIRPIGSQVLFYDKSGILMENDMIDGNIRMKIMSQDGLNEKEFAFSNQPLQPYFYNQNEFVRIEKIADIKENLLIRVPNKNTTTACVTVAVYADNKLVDVIIVENFEEEVAEVFIHKDKLGELSKPKIKAFCIDIINHLTPLIIVGEID